MGLRIYISGPLNSSGLSARNMGKACALAGVFRGHGWFPFVPHLNLIWHLISPDTEENWLASDKEWLLNCCHVNVRIPGISSGADKEESWSKDHNQPLILSTHPNLVRELKKIEKKVELYGEKYFAKMRAGLL